MNKIYSYMLVLALVLLMTGCGSSWYKKDMSEQGKASEEESGPVQALDEKAQEETEQSNTNKDQVSAGDVEDEPVIEGDKEEVEDELEDKPEVSYDPEAKALNTKGFAKYKEGDYKEALELFEQSYEKDDSYFLAHFNYACTIGLLMKEDYPQWYDKREVVYDHLKKVLDHKPDYIEKVRTDSDLEILRTDYEYYELIGYSMESAQDTQIFVENLNWYIQGAGVYSTTGGIDFLEGNRFRVHSLDFNKADQADFHDYTVEYFGTYVINGASIEFTLDKAMPASIYEVSGEDVVEKFTTFKGALKPGGILETDLFSFSFYSWYDEFSA